MRIIVVENKIPLNNSLAQILRQAGYFVDQAYDGQEALNQIDGHYHNLIILDMALPYVDGLQVIKTLRQKEVWTPILVLSTSETAPEIVNGQRTGADDYLPKPFAVDELLQHAQNLLRRQHSPSAQLNLAGLTLDPSTKKVTRAKQQIALSTKEYELLYYLLRQSPKIVTKQEILAHLWQEENTVNSRIVDTYICFLRRKIDKEFPQLAPLLHTIKNHGYKLSAESG